MIVEHQAWDLPLPARREGDDLDPARGILGWCAIMVLVDCAIGLVLWWAIR